MKRNRNILYCILIVFTLFTSLIKCIVGFDSDESYIVTMSMRLLRGDHLFKEMWELHQTSAFPVAMLAYFYQHVFGSLSGLILFLRIVTAIVQLLLGYFTWKALDKYYTCGAMLGGLFVANFLPRWTMNLEYGFLSYIGILMSSICLLVVVKNITVWSNGKIIRWSILAGGGLSIGVLSYPTMLIVALPLLVMLWILLKNSRTKRNFVVISLFGTCAVCALVFLCFVLSFVSWSEFISNVSNILLDGSHQMNPFLHMFTSIIWTLIEKKWEIAFILGCAIILWLLTMKILGQDIAFVYYILASGALMFIVPNITGIRVSGCLGLQIRYLLAVVGAIPFYIHLIKKDRELVYLFGVNGFFVFLGSCLGSNLGVTENASFLYLPLLGLILAMNSDNQKDSEENKSRNVFLIHQMIFLFLASIILCKGYNVRCTGTGPATIVEKRVEVHGGILKGIFVYPQDATFYESIHSNLASLFEPSDYVLCITKDAILNLETGANISACSTISTPRYGPQWIKYYDIYEEKMPTKVLLDTRYYDDEMFWRNSDFGKCLEKIIDTNSGTKVGDFIIYRKMNET